MYKIVLSPPAIDDIREVSQWYNKRKAGLGLQFVKRIKEVTAYIQENPNMAQIRFEDIRVAVVKQFPYTIHYKIKEELKTVLIHAILHDHRDPRVWSERITKD